MGGNAIGDDGDVQFFLPSISSEECDRIREIIEREKDRDPIWLPMPSSDLPLCIMVLGSVGYWECIEGYQWHSAKRPWWIHRLFARLFFGWRWRDKEQT